MKTQTTKNDLKVKFFQFSSLQKLKIFSGEISLNNMRSDLAVKWLSLTSVKSEQVSKICSMVKCLSHPMHIGSSSPFNKKEWVRKEWPMCNQAITVSSFLFFQGQDIHSFNTGNILYNLFSGNSSYSDCYSSNIYLFEHGFRSENGMSSTIKGNLSCRICSRISPNANMARNPDENNLSPLSCHFCI